MAVLVQHSGFWIAAFGTMVGMLGMRFASSIFSKLLEKYPSVSRIALWVVCLLGVKMTVTGVMDGLPETVFKTISESHETDMAFSFLILLMFLWPMFRQLLTKRVGKKATSL
ncbi:TerC family protein [Spirosoma utsteinense]|uniref:Tellurium resistance membrane protein TerC n=2 Tax=Spirosoma utsteinense TaxID=2585773 RepID=A0ABR6W2F6_9BACT|nr:hypothetical protein [Spirosoma utsteinense]MBC3784437.1 putative tellurium resistance membrane protein TerC [Spirosoma utsteinense]MBC3790762.1 putative tellurium resistance membrane protein TerC [Spirosoma utsteinense]